MIKNKKSILLVLLAILLGPSIVVYSYARSVSMDTVLDNSQLVITDENIQGSEKIAGTDYYVASIGLAKDAKKLPIIPYQQLMTVNDMYEPQDYLTLLNSGDFWDDTTDASGIVTAVIDGGFAMDHEDLSAQWYVNQAEYGTTLSEGPEPNCTSRSLALDMSCNNLDDDSNGYVDDWRGWDFAGDDNDPMAGLDNPIADGIGHGTEVAGFAGATGDNTVGGASLNWQSTIMPLQIFSDNGEATTLELASAIAYAIDNGADVINLSLGTTMSDELVDSLLQDAYEAGIVTVAAAGNCGGVYWSENGCDYEGQLTYPASNQFTIAVGATGASNDARATFSSRGNQLDIMAPGSGDFTVPSYVYDDETGSYTETAYGTSYATPIVSSLAAKLKAAWPEANMTSIRAAIIDSAKKVSGMSGSYFTTSYGFGRVQPLEALELAKKCRPIAFSADINCDGLINLLDLSLLSSQWQKLYTGRSDTNLSGMVDLLDLSNLASQWGRS